MGYEYFWGDYLHPTYAVTPGRVPLGVIDAWMWAREFKDKDGKRGGLCESVRWIEGYEVSVHPPSTRAEGSSRSLKVCVAHP